MMHFQHTDILLLVNELLYQVNISIKEPLFPNKHLTSSSP